MEDILKVIALVGAGIAFFSGLFQYRRGQKWKRVEWVAQEMKQLFSDRKVQAALLMLDWGDRYVTLNPDAILESERKFRVTDKTVTLALMSHRDRPEGFKPEEALIRDGFDTFLDGLERFASYVETGLVKVPDLAPYLKYWADNICKESTSNETEPRILQLRNYMDTYGYRGAYGLLRKIAPTKRSN